MTNKSKVIRFLGISIAVAGLAGCSLANPSSQPDRFGNVRSNRNYNQSASQSTVNRLDNPAYPQPTVIYDESSYSVEEMLTMAIEDEYLARQEYETILDIYGDIRPFTNIIQAEVNHIDMLEPLLDAYNVSIPKDTAIDQVVLPETLEATYEIGVQAEVNNIAMYERFLEEELPDDIRDVFQRLKNASYSHLEAFSRNLDGSTPNIGQSNGRSFRNGK